MCTHRTYVCGIESIPLVYLWEVNLVILEIYYHNVSCGYVRYGFSWEFFLKKTSLPTDLQYLSDAVPQWYNWCEAAWALGIWYSWQDIKHALATVLLGAVGKHTYIHARISMHIKTERMRQRKREGGVYVTIIPSTHLTQALSLSSHIKRNVYRNMRQGEICYFLSSLFVNWLNSLPYSLI